MAADRQPVRSGSPKSFLLVPVASRGRLYGFFGVGEKIGTDAFSEIDEIFAVTLGVQAGVAYENALLINELESQAATLRATEATTEFALMASGIGIFERDLITNEVKPSKSLAQVFPEAAHVTEMYALLHPDDRAAARAVVERAIQDRTDFTFDARMLDANGIPVHQQVRGRVLVNPRGVAERVVGVIIDMTERRRLEAQLRHAQKMEAVGQLAGGVAHDFNNLLTVILGYARLLIPSATRRTPRDVNEIVKAGERAVGLTRQLLAFSRRQTQDLTVFDLNALVRDLVQMLRRLIGEHVHLSTHLATALSPIQADRGQMEQVIMNLVVNARDAMPSGGDLRIETANAEGLDGRPQVRLSVTDTGTGMTEETRARIFEPFFTTKEVGKGTGLGLATVFGIVTQTGGTLHVDSTPGRGATFTTLPRAEEQLHTEQQRMRRVSEHRGERRNRRENHSAKQHRLCQRDERRGGEICQRRRDTHSAKDPRDNGGGRDRRHRRANQRDDDALRQPSQSMRTDARAQLPRRDSRDDADDAQLDIRRRARRAARGSAATHQSPRSPTATSAAARGDSPRPPPTSSPSVRREPVRQ